MKRIIILTVFIFGAAGALYAQVRPKVDERFELTSIAFRLAGAREYTYCGIEEYAEDIDSCFAAFKDHELIKYIRELKGRFPIGYDAVSGSAYTLQIRGGSIEVRPEADLKRFFEFEPRWTADTFERYVELLNDFYRDSRFHAFFESQLPLRLAMEEKYAGIVSGIDSGWFSSFFGSDAGNPGIFISLTNGPCNYGLTGPHIPDYGVLIGARDTPLVDEDLFVILHELCHNFTNPLYFQYAGDFAAAADKIHSSPFVRERMRNLAYAESWTMTLEWLNNLFAFMYLYEHGMLNLTQDYESYTDANYLAVRRECGGFIWFTDSMELMKAFYADRDKYRSIEEFIPRLAGFYGEVASDFEGVMARFIGKHPQVVMVAPEKISSRDTEIVVEFSHPMNDSHGLYPIQGVEALPRSGFPYWRDETTFVIPLDGERLKAGETYGITLNAEFFYSGPGYKMQEDYPVVYTL